MPHRRILAISILAVMVSSACASVPRLESGGLSEAADIPVTQFEIGDCFDDPTFGEVTDVPGLPCDVPHDNEIYAIFDHENSNQTWPGQDALDAYSFEACESRFQGYVASDYATSQLDISWFTPLEQGWEEGDHEIVCFLYDLDFAKLTGSKKNSGE